MINCYCKNRTEVLEKQGFCIHTADSRNVLLHGHNYLEFTYVQKGSAVHTIGGKDQIISEGDYFIVDYGTKHRYKSENGEPISVINLLFYPDFIDRTLGRWDDFEKVVNSYLIRFRYRSLNTSPAGTVFHDDGRILEILSSLVYEYERVEAGYLEYIRSLLTQILIITMRKISKDAPSPETSGIIKAITKDIKENYFQSLTLSDYAKKYNYSLSHISKKFKEEMGTGFTDYLQYIRIHNSCRLLETTDMSVGEVAAAVGYENVKFFGRLFKKNIGVTPKTFKKYTV